MYIEIVACPIPSCHGLHYDIIRHEPDRTFEGNANLVFKRIAEYRTEKHFKTDDIYCECLKRGLTPEDLIGHIRMFYPNGPNAQKKCMRKGTGTCLLQRMKEDLAKEEGKALYVHPTTPYMQKFLIKHNFAARAPFENQFYLYPSIA